MAFMFIITIMVIAICRVHLRRTAMAQMANSHMGPRVGPNAGGPFGDILFTSGGSDSRDLHL